MRCGVARRVMSLTLCIAVIVIGKEVQVLEGLVSPLFERAEGIGSGRSVDGSEVVALVIGVEYTRSWCLSLTSLGVRVDGTAHTSCHVIWL